VCVLAGAFDLNLGLWLAIHENLRTTPRSRAVFDGLASGLCEYLKGRSARLRFQRASKSCPPLWSKHKPRHPKRRRKREAALL
jgi:hypothetical protein